MITSKGMAISIVCVLTLGLSVQAGFIAPPVGATSVFSDDFDDYTNTAEMKAVWNAEPTGLATLERDYGVGGGNAVLSTGGPVIQRNFAEVSLSDAQPVVLEYDYWDYSTGSTDRLSVGIRNSDLSAIFEIGEHNSYDDGSNYPSSGNLVEGYGMRAAYVGAPESASAWQGNWLLTADRIGNNGNDLDPKWHHFKLVIGGTYATGSVLLSNGAFYARTLSLTDAAGDTLDNVRIGGPSGVASTGLGFFDNVQVYIAPEPTTLTLLLFGGIVMMRRTNGSR